MASVASDAASFGARLSAAVAERGRLCVGIDPHPSLLTQWDLPHTAAGLREFSQICVAAFSDTVAVVKPQVAFYEAYGSAGFAVLEETMAELRAAGVLVVADAKRGDIGSTMAAYAQAWLGEGSALSADALTVNPFLGMGALQPAIELAQENGRGLFFLAATSNPEARRVQDAQILGDTLSQDVVDTVAALNEIEVEQAGLGSFGVVVGATLTDPPYLSELGGPILMPGVGAQGATAADVDRIAGDMRHAALPNISRAILKQGPDLQKLRSAVLAAAEDFPA
ncbi:orotidine-5'-phosphate decarboxylase [Corynebacterium ulceribovis]|uniref:orotidine-5'-phosphate decarboxylase n=1 Tax=Corynebacterium ulceribovis TaxID=487732 RepID=UPI00037D35E1|nr:orotidine-5'-phosphate decarboxylase [Corynebacterium ulceribovis]